MLTLIVSVMQPLLGIIFVLNSDDKVTARIMGVLLAQIIIYTCCFIAQMIHGKKFFSKKYWIYVLQFNLPLVPHYLSQTVLNSADRIMIKNMVGAGEAGIYGLAYSLAQRTRQIYAVILQRAGFRPYRQPVESYKSSLILMGPFKAISELQ